MKIVWKNAEVEAAENPSTDCYDKEYLYIPISKIVGNRDGKWEHFYLHDFDDPENYYYSFPPVSVERKGDKYEFFDGFHRVNFCLKFSVAIPAVIFTAKENTHYHSVRMSGSTFRYRVWNKDCEKDLSENPNIRCKWSGKNEFI